MGKSCDICGEEHFEETKSCKSCNTIINRYKKCTIGEVRNALKTAHPLIKNGTCYFKCYYTGVESRFNTEKKSLDPIKDALILTIDHKNPTTKSKRGEVVVSLYIVNQIKGKIPSDNFKDIITVLAECLNDKTDQNSKKFENILLAIQNQRK
jgi:hypothetical protein